MFMFTILNIIILVLKSAGIIIFKILEFCLLFFKSFFSFSLPFSLPFSDIYFFLVLFTSFFFGIIFLLFKIIYYINIDYIFLKLYSILYKYYYIMEGDGNNSERKAAVEALGFLILVTIGLFMTIVISVAKAYDRLMDQLHDQALIDVVNTIIFIIYMDREYYIEAGWYTPEREEYYSSIFHNEIYDLKPIIDSAIINNGFDVSPAYDYHEELGIFDHNFAYTIWKRNKIKEIFENSEKYNARKEKEEQERKKREKERERERQRRKEMVPLKKVLEERFERYEQCRSSDKGYVHPDEKERFETYEDFEERRMSDKGYTSPGYFKNEKKN